MIDFYIDIGSSCLVQVLETCDCNTSVEKRKYHVLQFRVFVGFCTNLAVLIYLCASNADSFYENSTRIGLLSTLIWLLTFKYSATTFIALYKPDDDTFRTDENDENNVNIRLICYRLFEIDYDIFILFYGFELSDYEMTDIARVLTVYSIEITVTCI